MAQPVVHKLIAATAMEMAAATYEHCASESDRFYKYNKSQKRWVAKNWGMFVVTAREQLAGMLATNMSDILKEEIYDALIADASLPNVNLSSQVKLN